MSEPLEVITMPGTLPAVNHTDRYAGVSHGSVVAVAGGADPTVKLCPVTVDIIILHCADRDGPGGTFQLLGVKVTVAGEALISPSGEDGECHIGSGASLSDHHGDRVAGAPLGDGSIAYRTG